MLIAKFLIPTGCKKVWRGARWILTLARPVREAKKCEPQSAQQVVRLQFQLKTALARSNKRFDHASVAALRVDLFGQSLGEFVIGFPPTLPFRSQKSLALEPLATVDKEGIPLDFLGGTGKDLKPFHVVTVQHTVTLGETQYVFGAVRVCEILDDPIRVCEELNPFAS
jgi:hypothetical protein